MRKRYYGSLSLGKNSLCMIFKLVEEGYPLDEVVFYNTGMEFQALYDTREMILPYLQE